MIREFVKQVCLVVIAGGCLGLGLVLIDTAYSAEMKPMPNATDNVSETLGRGGAKPPGDKPEGLAPIDTPKFVFGAGIAGLIMVIVGAVIKLAIIAGLVAIVYVYVRHRRGTSEDGTKKDVVDALIATFEDAVERVRSERQKRVEEVAKLDKSVAKLKKGVINALAGKESETD